MGAPSRCRPAFAKAPLYAGMAAPRVPAAAGPHAGGVKAPLYAGMAASWVPVGAIRFTHDTLYARYALRTTRFTHDTLYARYALRAIRFTRDTLYARYALRVSKTTTINNSNNYQHSEAVTFSESDGLNVWCIDSEGATFYKSGGLGCRRWLYRTESIVRFTHDTLYARYVFRTVRCTHDTLYARYALST